MDGETKEHLLFDQNFDTCMDEYLLIFIPTGSYQNFCKLEFHAGKKKVSIKNKIIQQNREPPLFLKLVKNQNLAVYCTSEKNRLFQEDKALFLESQRVPFLQHLAYIQIHDKIRNGRAT